MSKPIAWRNKKEEMDLERPTKISQLVITGDLEEFREYSQREYPQQALTIKAVGKHLYTFVLNVIAPLTYNNSTNWSEGFF